MNDKKISLVIPIYLVNKDLVKMTDECLTSLFQNTNSGVELIIVDDGSPIKYMPNFGKLVRIPTNSGYAHAANAGLQAATGDILILGNNDLVFPENWLPALLFPLNVGYDVATVWTSDQPNVVLEDRIEEGARFGSLFAMNREVYEKIGGFDEQFRSIFSDTDLRRRMLDQHIRIGKNLSEVVTHLARATHKVVDEDNSEGEFLMNQRLFEAKHGTVE